MPTAAQNSGMDSATFDTKLSLDMFYNPPRIAVDRVYSSACVVVQRERVQEPQIIFSGLLSDLRRSTPSAHDGWLNSGGARFRDGHR